MSFERVHNFIVRHSESTLVVVVNGRAKCMALASKRAMRILKGRRPEATIVGTYNRNCPEKWIAQDLLDAGIEV